MELGLVLTRLMSCAPTWSLVAVKCHTHCDFVSPDASAFAWCVLYSVFSLGESSKSCETNFEGGLWIRLDVLSTLPGSGSLSSLHHPESAGRTSRVFAWRKEGRKDHSARRNAGRATPTLLWEAIR